MGADDYYPFGLTFNEHNSGVENQYKYNGKEEQDELGLGWYDYGARMYDAALGRFQTQDRLAEKYYGLSPYQYAGDNPILFVDINGDSINFSHLMRNDLNALSNILLDLSEQTGLSLSVDSKGNLNYSKNA